MSETDNNNSHAQTNDPFEPFRAMRDNYLDAMAKTMVEAVNTESLRTGDRGDAGRIL